MALPNDLTRISDGIAGNNAAKNFGSNAKRAARTMIRDSFVLIKPAVDGLASTTTVYTAGFAIRMPRAARILGAAFVPSGAATADAANTATLNVVKGDGLGGAEVIMASYTSNVAGGSLAAGVVKALTVSATLVNTRIPAGSVLAFSISKAGTGVAIPPGNFTVDLEWEDVDGYGA